MKSLQPSWLTQSDTEQLLRWNWAMKSCVWRPSLCGAGPPASESDCLSTRLLCLSVVWHVEGTWRNADALARICCRCCASCGGELGSSWVAGQRAGPPWLAPVILPSHSSARDINNNSTSGFTLLSHVNPFYSAASGLSPKPPSPTKDPLLLLSVFVSVSSTAAVSFFSFTQNRLPHLKRCVLAPVFPPVFQKNLHSIFTKF